MLSIFLSFVRNKNAFLRGLELIAISYCQGLQYTNWFAAPPHKIVIAGNHETGFDSPHSFCEGTYRGYKLLTNCTYLRTRSQKCMEFVSTEPLTTFFNIGHISTPIDVLMTHTPPLGHMDWVDNSWDKGNVGCPELLNCVEKRIKPKFHVFGHIHENNGLTTNEETVFVNASICDDRLNVVNNPIIFDIDLPEGIIKD
uniref:Calcineurin-like phosphoesterase domain-containing protein n=1 Tax=Ditylenchus dipsaci TaxID=166011 RepID=A0A915DBD2_9BILA